jgi:phage N-6-adenine-methyltransferase
VRVRQSELFHESGGLDSVDDRRTPRSLFDPVHARFRFTIDVAASSDNAMLPRYYDRLGLGAANGHSSHETGLTASWKNERVWCNPPYSSICDWVHKAFFETRDWGCPLVVMLLPADRTEQPWWQEYVEPYRDGRDSPPHITTEFIAKRVKFGLPPEHPDADKGLANGKKGGGYRYPPFGCVLVIFEKGGA